MNVLFLDVEPLYDDLLPAGLRQVGCNVRTLTEVLDGRLEQELANFTPDFILTLGWSWFPTPERLDLIHETAKRHGIPIVSWMTEDPCWHEHYSVPYVQRLKPDLVLTICAEYVEKYEAMGFPVGCLPFGYNHDLYQSVPPKPEFTCDIAVVANFYTAQYEEMNRKRSLEALVRPLLERGHDIKIWGNNWDRAPEFGFPPLADGIWRGYLNHRETPAVYNAAKIVIGVQNEFDFETNLTMRTCEVMGAGGFLLTSRTKAVERFFVHRRHLVMSGSPEETLRLVDHYLLHPKERQQIAAAGQALVETQHSYAHRALEALSLFGRMRTGRTMRGAFAVTPALEVAGARPRAEVGARHRAEVEAGPRAEVAVGSGDSLQLVAGTKSRMKKFPCCPYRNCSCCHSGHHHHHHHCDSSDTSTCDHRHHHHHCDSSDTSSCDHRHHHHQCDCSDTSTCDHRHHHHHCDCSDTSSCDHRHHRHQCDCSDTSTCDHRHHHHRCDCSDTSTCDHRHHHHHCDCSESSKHSHAHHCDCDCSDSSSHSHTHTHTHTHTHSHSHHCDCSDSSDSSSASHSDCSDSSDSSSASHSDCRRSTNRTPHLYLTAQATSTSLTRCDGSDDSSDSSSSSSDSSDCQSHREARSRRRKSNWKCRRRLRMVRKRLRAMRRERREARKRRRNRRRSGGSAQ